MYLTYFVTFPLQNARSRNKMRAAPGVGKRADSCYNISSISIFLLNGRES